jgi:hypothetical protein
MPTPPTADARDDDTARVRHDLIVEIDGDEAAALMGGQLTRVSGAGDSLPMTLLVLAVGHAALARHPVLVVASEAGEQVRLTVHSDGRVTGDPESAPR